MDIEGMTIAITGATGGIGGALARALDERGARLVLTARNESALVTLAASLNREPAILAADITDPRLPDQLLALALDRHGGLDVLVNNAGVLVRGGVDDLDVEAACRMVDVNVTAPIRIAYVALRHFQRQRRGHLINISSIAGLRIMYPEVAVYAATKHAIEAFSASVRPAVAEDGVGITCIEPGLVRTGLYDQWDPDARRAIRERPSLAPDDVARAVLFVLDQPDHVRVPQLFLIPAGEAG